MKKTKTRKSAAQAAEKATFDPHVLVFACNWCSYAGADTAGVSRLPQTPHFRLLRVMCSGRVHPSFVLRAFARGADGVMVSGCHLGDCHYRFGNYRAVEQYEKMQALVALLGLEPERLRLEWISAAEGIRFAEIMNEFVEQVRAVGRSPIAPADGAADGAAAEVEVVPDLQPTRVLSCLECGRCTAVCPVAPYQRFSPRRLVSRLVSEGLERMAAEPSLWSCLTCERCSAVCPMGIDYSAFILQARAAAVAADLAPGSVEPPEAEAALTAPACEVGGAAPEGIVPCSHGGVFEQISICHTRASLRQKRCGWLTEDLRVDVLADGQAGTAEDLLFVGCSPYFAAYFGGETGEGLTRAMRAVVQLLNRAGIRPAILANERCCGHHMRISGRVPEAERLERMVAEQITQSGARRVITICPECLVALRETATRLGASYEVVHASELLAPKAAELAPARQRGPTETVSYQDPCRLGRRSNLYDAPRKLLAEVAGVEIAEMEHSRERAICCGNTAWLTCNAGTKALQTARLREATDAGSHTLVTACPGCYIHLRCALEGAAEDASENVKITDIWNLLADALPDAEPSEDGRE